MLRLRVSVPGERADELVAALRRADGVSRLVSAPTIGSADEIVLSADVHASAADAVLAAVRRTGVAASDYVLAREDVVAPSALDRRPEGADVAWIEVLGEARANARPIGRYIALMAVAGVIAALGVIEGNAILIVGAMAVSPDLLPICATCVGLVGARGPLTGRAFLTLCVGLLLVVVVAALLTVALDLTGFLSDSFQVEDSPLSNLATTDYSTVLVALAAGVAAILAFETRASTAVGVAISVTTIPASAYLGVAFGLGEQSRAGGALVVLVVNVALLIVSGSLTLATQQRLARARRPAA